jgi:formylglycine-generating enzyme required for sulfatase activity
MIGELRRAKGVRIAILDACRDNAAEQALKQSRGAPSRGLAPPKNPAGLIIAYATQHGATAADSGISRNSPFTAALLHNIATPGLDVTDMFRKVGREVDAATGGRQRPEISISMYEQYALAPAVPAPASPAAAAPVPQPQVAMVDTPVQRNTAPLTAERERGLKPNDTFRECENCPEMVVVPEGKFTMGSSANEPDGMGTEAPQHVVTIRKAFAVGKLHVTVDQYKAFVQETGYERSGECSWRSPGVTQEGSHPVVCVSWDDANAYVNWLTKKTGKLYRLLSEAEFEYAARGRTSPGTYPRFWFGNDENELCRYGNFWRKAGQNSACDDGYAHTSPAGHYRPNDFGLYDMAGNAWQWTADCWHDRYEGAPADGSAWITACRGSGRVIRGGSWGTKPVSLRAAARAVVAPVSADIGFRLARTLIP